MNNHFENYGLRARLVTRAIIGNNSGRYLFERRPSNSKFSPKRLQLFGGKVDPEDESTVSGLKRELQEELAIDETQINSIEAVGAELSSDGMWLTYFFLVILSDEALNQLSGVDNLIVLNREELQLESGPIIDENRGGDIAFDHGLIVLENI